MGCLRQEARQIRSNGGDDEVGKTYTQEADAAGRAFLSFIAHDDSKKDDYKKQ